MTMYKYLLIIVGTVLNSHLSVSFPQPVSPPPLPDHNFTLPTEPTSVLDFGQEWTNWKVQNQRWYADEEEESYRRDVWLSNKMYIDEHNQNEAERAGFHLAMNQFGDLTYSEWKVQYLTHYTPNNFTNCAHTKKRLSTKLDGVEPYSPSMDWRNKNAVSPVKNQGKCASSYAFSAVSALEGAASLAQDKLVTLSEQNIIDCSIPYGNNGCDGGTVNKAYQYVISVGGIETDKDYPFSGKQETCHYKKDDSGVSMSGIIRLPSGSEVELLTAVATVGPVSINVDGSSNSFRFYSRGVFNTIHCSTSDLNQAMVITGYGETKDGRKYWLVKNSWGTNWGEKGYILMARDNYNQCGIATDALYPTL